MPVSAVGGFSPLLPFGPAGLRPGAGGFTVPGPVPPTSSASAAALAAIQQVEEMEHGGGGGGAGGHGHKAALKAIEDVAARVGLKIETHEKTPAEREAEIERLKLLAVARDGQVNPRQDGDGRGGRQPRDEQPQDGGQPGEGREQPAAR